MSHNIKPGVATGDQVQEIFNYAKQKGFALPAVNVVGSSTINGVLETAAKLNAPVIIQFSNGGAQFNAGKGLSNENQQSAILGAVAGAKHIHTLAEAYGATVILHTDHCAKNLLPWTNGNYLNNASSEYIDPVKNFIGKVFTGTIIADGQLDNGVKGATTLPDT